MSNEQTNVGTPATDTKTRRALLAEIAQIALDSLRTLFDSTFSACDDVFFDLASRAHSNADQAHYFESLREIRVQKSRVQTNFLALVDRAFTSIDRRPEPQSTTSGDDTAEPALELVSHEQMEITALSTDMVTRARNEWQDELFQIRDRLQAISRPLAEHASPLDPETITSAFIEAAKPIVVSIDIRKIILRQFNQQALMHLDRLLDPVNERLIAANVLPELGQQRRRRIKKSPSTPQRSAAADPAADPGAQPGTVSGDSGLAGMGIPEADREMRELAQVLKRLHDGGIRLPMLQAMPVQPASSTTPAIPRDELLSLLAEVKLTPGDETEAATVPLDIRSAIASIVANRGQIALAQTDEDIINVVAMFFDIILDDRNLPLEIQALVSRLQLPILKVALRDRAFFTDRKHPARQLINEIARTSIGWEASNKDQQDALFIRLTELVEMVLHDSNDGSDIFEKCLNDLMDFIAKQDAHASKQEQRTRERTAARTRTAHAREVVNTLLNERLEGAALAPDITDFLVNDWQRVMLQRHLKYETQSPEWQEAIQILDDLVWAGQAHPGPEARARLSELVGRLRPRIAAVLEDAGTDLGRGGAALKQVTAALARIHAGQVDAAATRPLSEEQRQRIEPVQAAKPWQEMTAVERQMVRQQQLLDEHLSKVDALEVGTWLQYDDLRSGVSRRCKLTARLAEIDTFVFVNRMGAKVYEKPRKAFAYDLQMGYARVLETRPFFDRTLERITSNLRKLAET